MRSVISPSTRRYCKSKSIEGDRLPRDRNRCMVAGNEERSEPIKREKMEDDDEEERTKERRGARAKTQREGEKERELRRECNYERRDPAR